MTASSLFPDPVSPSSAGPLSLIWTLARKDLVDAFKIKSTLTTIVTSLVMVLIYRYMPLLSSNAETLNVRLYAETESTLTTALASSPALAVYTYPSRERLMAAFTDAEDVELALEIPQSVVEQQQTGGPVTLTGHVMYWINASQRAEITALIEQELGDELKQPVMLDLEGHDVYFDADRFFFVFSPTVALLFVTLMVGISLVPNLMIEEKQNGTLDMLLVSPVSAIQVVAGKALAGVILGLASSAIALFTFRHLILQWGLAVIAALLAIAFMVAVGLLLGGLLNIRAQLQMVSWFVILPLLLPVVLVALRGLVPEGAVAVMSWVPTVLIAYVYRLSLTPNASPAHYGVAVAVCAAATLLLLALVVDRVHRQDRA